MQQIILLFHVLFSVAIIALVLVQQGKGAGMGASFGSGGSQTVFGSQGSGGFLLKLIGGLVILFFITSLTLSYMSTKAMKRAAETGALQGATQISKTETPRTATPSVPATPQSTLPTKQVN